MKFERQDTAPPQGGAATGMDPAGTNPARYPRTAVLLHWTVALLVIALMASGWYMVDTPRNTPERALWFNLHKSLGVVAAMCILALIVWRIRHVVPPLPATMARWERVAAVLNHRLFYGFLVLVTAAGYLTSSFSKYGPKLFGLPLREDFATVHRVAALVFAVLIALHIAAALKHLLFDKDGVFQRMLPD